MDATIPRLPWAGLWLALSATLATAQEGGPDVGQEERAGGAAEAGEEAAEEEQGTPPWRRSPEQWREEEEPQEKVTDRPLEEVESLIDRTLARIKGSVESADFPALEIERRRRLVRELSTVPHPKTLDALKKILTGRYEPEVRGAAAWSLGHMKFERDATAKYLCSRIKKEWKEEAVLVGIAQGLGELRRAPDTKAMYSYFNHPSDAVYVSMIECLGVIGDKEHLAKLYDIFSQYARKSTGGSTCASTPAPPAPATRTPPTPAAAAC